MVVNSLSPIQLAANQPNEWQHPIGFVFAPFLVDRTVWWQLPDMRGLGSSDRILPDLTVIGQRLNVLCGLLFVAHFGVETREAVAHRNSVLVLLAQRLLEDLQRGRVFTFQNLFKNSQVRGLPIK